jgi:amino acid adenylation domain-containing protein/FkbM family methyltransferase
MSEPGNPSLDLSATKRALFDLLLEEEGLEPAAVDLIPRRPAGAEPPLSFAQQRLWLLDRLEPGNPAYNLPVATRLVGSLSPPALAWALAKVAGRHEALRTVLPAGGGAPVQRVLPAGPVPLPAIDLGALPVDRRAGEAAWLAAAEALRAFDLAAGPLLRATLVRLAGDEHLLLLTLHHVAADGWSLGILLRELAELYTAGLGGRRASLPGLPIQYADYALWQRGRLIGERLEEQLAYWRQRLAGAPPRLELPADRPRPAVLSPRGGSLRVAIPAPLARAAAALGLAEGCTPFMTFLAAFAALLHRWSGQEDVLVGAPAANRDRPEIEGVIGFFANTLVLRLDLGDDPGIRVLLARARQSALGAWAHQELPFERLVEELRPERARSHAPLVQVALALQPPLPALDLPDLRLLPAPVAAAAKFDLTLSLSEMADGGLEGVLEYSADLFDPATLARFRAHFEAALAGMAADPRLRVSGIPLLGSAERHQLLVEWNDTRAGYPRDSTVHRELERQVARDPERVAILGAGERLSYGELDRRAGRLARRLRRLGVGPGTLVALAAERSAGLVAAMLAVLKAGGAYLPLDPGYPRERLAYLLADSGARVLLAGEALLDRLPAEGLAVILLDRPETWAEDEAEEGGAAPEAAADDLAYVMYTSGSTGRPKGVAVTHRNVLRLVLGTGYARFGPEEVVLQMAPVSFDPSTFEIWGALLHGARLVVPPAASPSLPELSAALAAHGVTTLWLTAGLFHQLVDQDPAALAPVTQLLAGGDVVSPEHARRFLAALPASRLINAYGPTETTTYACCHPMASPAAVATPVPIGRPIANTQVYLVDPAGRPVPIGIAGELLIGDDGVARGYLGRPELTAGRFVPDPWGEESGARLYRTGDRARLLADGRIEFLGRLDRQVKVRGFRIEPGEIEAALARHPAVEDCAVVPRGSGAEDRRLVAYLVPRAGFLPPGGGELRAFLRGALPEPLIPSFFIALAALPLTPNGKLDRDALPAPAPAAGEPAGGLPETPVEELLAGIWAELLVVEAAGMDDDFFALGGHSLLALQLLARVRSALRVELPLAAVFAAPTPRALAASVESARRQGLAGAPPPLARREHGGRAPVSFAQERLWFLDQLDPGTPVYDVPLAVELTGRLDPGALAGALSALVRRQEALATVFAAGDEGPLQVLLPPSPVPLPLVDLSALPGERRAGEGTRLAGEEAARPFDLERGPLLRATLVRSGAGEHTALLNLHHIVTDGWSMGVLVRETAALYRAAVAGEPSPLPELPVRYADYARWQREWLSGDALAAAVGWWRETLAGAPPELALPTDRPRPAAQTVRGAVATLTLPADLARGLHALCRREGATLFMALLAAFEVLLARYCRQEDLLVGTPVANRRLAEVEGVIGLFVNTLVLRGDLAGDPAWSALLARVRAAALEAYERQDLPFERLVEELKPERRLSRSPLVQVMLVLQNTPAAPLALPGLTLTPRALPTGTARFDWTLAVEEREEGLATTLEYNSDLFDAGTARRALGHFRNLLAGALADPGLPLSELPLLSPGELHQLLAISHAAEGPPGRADCLHRLFREQAARTPDAVAVVWGEERRTYAELDRRSDRLARHLRRLGVGPEVRVALATRRTPEMIAAMLAVWKAGGAYVPIDPGYPAPRIAFLLAESGAPLLLTEGALAERLPAGGARVALLDEMAEMDGEETAAGEVDGGALPGNLAYLIFTSGSTGRPKAVAIEHASAAALVAWSRGVYPPEDLAGVLAATSVCFDLSIFEIFVPLCRGGRVILADEALRLPELPACGEVTLVDTVPSVYAELLSLGGMPPAVRTVNLGGEPLPAELARATGRLPGPPRLINLYGPSEDTTCSTWAEVAPGDPFPAIGRPLDNTRAYLVGCHLDLLPDGLPGELLLGGDGLTRGYLGRPELTAERFVPDPFGSVPGGRLYRTGDLARRRPSGDLEFLGRLDHQVKLRGFRIELGEVEAALARHPAVRETAAAVHGAGAGARLVAYAVLREPGRATAAGLRAVLRETLPAAMVPSAVMILDALPRTLTGKLDRGALPAPPASRESAAAVPPAAGNPVEESLAALWSELLGVARPGAEESFFDLGGHSLLATRMLARVRQDFAVDLPLRTVFEAPTLAALAARIAAAAGEEAPPLAPLPAAERAGDLPLSFAQERLWVLAQLDPLGSAYNLPAGLALGGALDVAALAAALAGVVHRHEALRTTYAAVDGRPVQRISADSRCPLPVVDLAVLPAGTAAGEALRLAAEEGRRPFDLAARPPLRCRLLRLAADAHALLVTVHHIATDGWSVGVFHRDLAALYQALAAGAPPGLPDLPVQYADYAAWQRRWLAAGALERQLAYWRERLAGAPAALELPTDLARPAVRTLRSATAALQLDRILSDALAALGRRQGATPFMTLCAAFASLLGRLAGQEDLVIGAPIANRRRPEVEGLIGCFVNALALRVDLAADPSFAALLGRVREASLGAYAHQDLPFARLVEELAPTRDLSRAPIFQVMLNGLDFAPTRAELPGLALAPLAPPEPSTDLDLILAVQPAAEGLHLELIYSRELWSPERAAELLGQLRHLLERAAADPEAPVSLLSLVTPAARGVLPVPEAPLPASWGGAVHERFARRAAAAPERIAVADDQGAWTYGELAAVSHRIARRLAAGGVGREDVVAIWAQRSATLAAAVLGVLEAGAAFLLLDPAHPARRLEECLRQARPRAFFALAGAGEPPAALRALVAELPLRLDLPDGSDLAVHPALAALAATPLGGTVAPDDLAYVAFTSGSTGAPKGILGTHRPLSHFFAWYEERFAIGGEDRFCLLSGLGHDPLLRDLLMPLWAGARLAVPAPETARSPRALAEWMAREEVSVAHLTPGLAQLLADGAGEDLRLPALRLVAFGGDLLTAGGAARVRLVAPAAALVNFYGATETPQAMGFHPLPAAGAPPGRERVPLGRGIPGVDLLVLNAAGRLAGIGELGEIHVRTPYLSRGYLGDGALTRERFPPNPATGDPADRLYRTGDLGRYRPDGEVDFAGRRDGQVKVRGYRIETEDVETVLRRHPDVREVTVGARDDGPAGARLVAWAVARSARSPFLTGRRRRRLPDGSAVVELNRGETDYLYREIFELQAYLRHGITLEDGDCVFDVGANIGLFRLFVHRLCRHPAVYSFEPNPAVFEILRANAGLHAPGGELFDFGLSSSPGRREFTFYTGFSLLSGLYADAATERRVLKSFLSRRREAESGDFDELMARADEVLDPGLATRTFPVEMRTLSQVIAQRGIERIDLLKVNVEKSELDVLLGLAAGDWEKVRQLAVEVDVAANLDPLLALLDAHGFETAVHQDAFLRETELHYIYAARRGGPRRLRRDPGAGSPPRTLLPAGEPFLTLEELRGFAAELLPEPMLPSALVLLDALPLTPSGKVDRRALPEPERARAGATAPYAPPRTAAEEALTALWAEVLGVERVGVADSFFELGGHSLLATRLLARVRDRFGVDLPLRGLFEAPTVAGMAARLDQGRGAQAAALPILVPDPDERHLPFPLTDLQQAYWIGRGAGLELGGVATHVYLEIEAPDLDLVRLQRAWRRLVARHDMLRAVVLPDGRQQILPAVPPYVIARHDLTGGSREEVAAELAAVRERMSHQVLDAARWPLFELRASLTADGVRLHVSFDFLIADARSLRVLLSELARLYLHTDLPLPPIEVSFRDYVLAELALRGTEAHRRAAEYWHGHLAGLPPAPELPLLPAAPGSAPRFVRRSAGLPPAEWERLKARAAAAGLSPSSALLAAFAAVLAAWSKSPRFTLNLTLFNRLPLHPQVDDLVGDFTSVTLLAVDGRPGEGFATGARRLQERLWSDLDHRLVSGVEVLRELARLRGGGLTALAPVVFTSTVGLGGADPGEAPALGELVYAISQTPQVLLDHQATEQDGTLAYNWDAVADLFPAGLLDDAFAAYRSLLGRLAAEESAWGEAPQLVPPADLALAAAANATAAPVPAGLLHQPFLEQARRAPERPAVISSRGSLSYGELRALSNRLGRRLRALGARPGQRVAVVMEKGWEQAAAVLGVLVSGAAYLPIDPDLPAERLRFLIAKGDVDLAVTQPWFAGSLAWPEGVRRLTLEDPEVAAEDAGDPPAVQSPEDLAYVIFTSGSTGRPKGVMIDHRGALNTVIDVNRRFGVGPGDRVLALSALNFDLSVWDLFGVLGAGGTVVFPEPWANRDPAHWTELLLRFEVTLWNSVPTLLEMWVDYAAGRPGPVPGALRLALLSGDWIPLTLPDRARALVPGCEVLSLGGATEASIWSILYPIGAVDPAWRSIPYGKAMANQTFHVLDGALAQRPLWVPGELYIGGAGLALGYLGDEEKTRASFVTHPETGERLYRTGDLGRLLPGGNIEFLGREDFQVKVQGHRIELGEIETALLEHPGVRAAVVAAVGEARGPRRLVAWVVPAAVPEAASEGPEAPGEGALLDPVARLDFKLSHPGRRREGDAPGALLELIRPERDEALLAAYRARRSERGFLARPIAAEPFGRFLAALLALDVEDAPLPRYRYPSAGSLYPVQAYLSVREGAVEGLAAGIYYYDPGHHGLLPLAPGAAIGPEVHAPVNRPMAEGAGFCLLLVGRLAAIAPLYGELARDFCLIEAGAMAQLLMTAAPASGIGLCPVGALDFERVRPLLDLEEGHVFLHALLGGPVDPARPATTALPTEAAVAGGLAAELRAFLQRKLPEWMVPGAFVTLAALPLTANGKVDRQALPAPEAGRSVGQSPFEAPRTELEAALAAVFREVLGVERVGLDDNFFDLGGTSVHIIQVHSRLRSALGREVPIVEMFRHPTLRALAAFLGGSAEEDARPAEVAEGRDRAAGRRASRGRRGRGPVGEGEDG